MTDPDDVNLQGLWQSGVPVDVAVARGRLLAFNRSQRRINLVVLAAGILVWAAIAAAEAGGLLASSGWATAGFGLFLAACFGGHLLAARRLRRAYAAAPEDVAGFAGRRMRAGLWFARGLYLLVPVLVAGGFVLGSLVGGRPLDGAWTLGFTTALLVTGAVAAGIGGLGIWLAAVRRRQLEELESAREHTDDLV